MIVRAAAAVLLGLVAVALAGCSHSPSPAAGGCEPGWPHVSKGVVRAGDTVTVSVSAVGCTPRFADDRALVLTWEDHAGHRSRLTTVHAYPSGAFEREVTIPTTAAVGGGSLDVSGVEVPCGDTASCAAYGTGVTVVDSTPDFASSARANRIASEIAEPIQTSWQDRASFGGIAIVTDGISVALHSSHLDAETAAVERAFAAAKAAVPGADRAVAARAHLHVVSSRHSEASLERLTMRIAHDSAWQKRHQVQLSVWSGDTATDSVRIQLVHYDDATAQLLVRRYGPSVTVSTKDTPIASAA